MPLRAILKYYSTWHSSLLIIILLIVFKNYFDNATYILKSLWKNLFYIPETNYLLNVLKKKI